jgi:hypothetical protein
VLGWIIADVDRSDQILREVACDTHAFEGENRPQTTTAKLGIGCAQIVMGNPERILLLSFQGPSPEPVPCDFVIDLGDKDPIRPAPKRGAHPFDINFRGCALRHLWVGVVAAKVVSECPFVYGRERWEIRWLRATNRQLFVSSRGINFFDWRARKIEDEIL